MSSWAVPGILDAVGMSNVTDNFIALVFTCIIWRSFQSMFKWKRVFFWGENFREEIIVFYSLHLQEDIIFQNMFEALKLLRVRLVESPVIQIHPLIFCPKKHPTFIQTLYLVQLVLEWFWCLISSLWTLGAPVLVCILWQRKMTQLKSMVCAL